MNYREELFRRFSEVGIVGTQITALVENMDERTAGGFMGATDAIPFVVTPDPPTVEQIAEALHRAFCGALFVCDQDTGAMILSNAGKFFSGFLSMLIEAQVPPEEIVTGLAIMAQADVLDGFVRLVQELPPEVGERCC